MEDSVSFEYNNPKFKYGLNKPVNQPMAYPSVDNAAHQEFYQSRQQMQNQVPQRYVADQQSAPPFDPRNDQQYSNFQQNSPYRSNQQDIDQYQQNYQKSPEKKRRRFFSRKKDPEMCGMGNCGNGGFCLPLVLYLIISFIIIPLIIVFSKQTVKFNLAHILFQIVWLALFSWFIYFLCKKNNLGWAWVIAVLAIIIQIVLVVVTSVWIF